MLGTKLMSARVGPAQSDLACAFVPRVSSPLGKKVIPILAVEYKMARQICNGLLEVNNPGAGEGPDMPANGAGRLGGSGSIARDYTDAFCPVPRLMTTLPTLKPGRS